MVREDLLGRAGEYALERLEEKGEYLSYGNDTQLHLTRFSGMDVSRAYMDGIAEYRKSLWHETSLDPRESSRLLCLLSDGHMEAMDEFVYRLSRRRILLWAYLDEVLPEGFSYDWK